MRGTTFKRCACRDEGGKQLGQSCPQLRSTRHGSWYFVLRVPGQQHPVKKGGFATQAAADKALQALRSKVTSGTDLTAGQQTVADYLEEWLAGKAGPPLTHLRVRSQAQSDPEDALQSHVAERWRGRSIRGLVRKQRIPGCTLTVRMHPAMRWGRRTSR
jgi:hypothetical protein